MKGRLRNAARMRISLGSSVRRIGDRIIASEAPEFGATRWKFAQGVWEKGMRVKQGLDSAKQEKGRIERPHASVKTQFNQGI